MQRDLARKSFKAIGRGWDPGTLVTVASPEKMATKVFGIIIRASVVGT